MIMIGIQFRILDTSVQSLFPFSVSVALSEKCPTSKLLMLNSVCSLERIVSLLALKAF